MPSPRLAEIQGTRASQHLDLVRGLAAVAVLVYHVRYRFFLDFADVQSPSLLARGWYILTAFGHDAVVVFFVLSGFFIGSAVIRDHRLGRWSWKEYAASRLVRLYLVLIPGLLLTVFWDQMGLHWFGNHPIYTGGSQPWISDYFNIAAVSGPGTLLGNALFVQVILTPPFGSNAALWSLSFEFWYYVLWPLAIAVLLGIGIWRRAVGLILGTLALIFVGPQVASYFPLWVLGAVVGQLPMSDRLAKRASLLVPAALLAGVVMLAVTHLGRVRALAGNSNFVMDCVTAVMFAIALYVVLHDRRRPPADRYGGLAHMLSGCSYTLYLVHLPVLLFLRAALTAPRPWAPTTAAIGVGLIISAVVFLYALGVAALTEAHTATVRARLFGARRRLPGNPPSPA
jgi:peptidoglycan/LPS O-acetylase OafA/YrhL